MIVILMKIISYVQRGIFFRKLWIYLFVTCKFYRLFGLFFYYKQVKANKIVFTNYYGAGYGDNPKYIADYILDNDLNYELVWLVDLTKIRDLTFPDKIRIAKYYSISSLMELSTAGIWIDNCRKMYTSIKKQNQIYVQTWHGSLALKKIEKDAENLPKDYIAAAINDSKLIDIILSGSEFKSDIFKKSFWYNGQILNFGTPRTDIFFSKVKIDKARDKIHSYYNIPTCSRILLYAPTFRNASNFEIYTLPYGQLQSTLKTKFGSDWVIVCRLHPNLIANVDSLQIPAGVINATLYSDMQELLCAADVVITDYSGLMFDYYLLNRPIFLYCADLDDYLTNDRELYFSMNDLPFSLSRNNSELLQNIFQYSDTQYQEKIDSFKRKIGLCETGEASANLLRWLEEKSMKTDVV